MIKEAYPLRNKDSDKYWYKSLPYAFLATIGNERRMFYLPISPQNLNITTHFATNVIATLHSTVEEHSDVRYYDITIQGTTGFAPKFYKEVDTVGFNINGQSSGRESYGGSILSDLNAGGFMKKSIALAQSIGNTASDLFNQRTHESGVFTDNNGYVAFHNFYRFLLKYKKAATNMKEQSKTPLLEFINYKDNNQYSCAIQRFVLERNAENPMLYNYQIQMRAYNLSTIENNVSVERIDAIEKLGLKETKKSLAAKISEKVRLAKNGVNAARNLTGSVGR